MENRAALPFEGRGWKGGQTRTFPPTWEGKGVDERQRGPQCSREDGGEYKLNRPTLSTALTLGKRRLRHRGAWQHEELLTGAAVVFHCARELCGPHGRHGLV